MIAKLKLIDLFCGVGGLSHGFKGNDNFEIVAANDLLPDMCRSYALNHEGVKVYCGDIKDFGRENLIRDLGEEKAKIDIVVGGPPCQAYSTVGKRLIADPRGKLFQEYFRILQEFNPKFFLFENVKGLLSMQGGELLQTIVELFQSLGYKTSYKVLDAVNFGTPQYRERVILVGSKISGDFSYPNPTHSNPKLPRNFFNNALKPFVTLGEALGDLPLIKDGEESFKYATEPQNEYQLTMRKGGTTKLTDHNASKHGEGLLRIMRLLPEGGMPSDLPEDIRPKSGFPNTYSRLWWDRPATTVTRNLGTPSSSRCIHPKVNRALTSREGARLQGFPDDFVFYGSRTSKNLQIGNSVPTFLSTALANSVAMHFLNSKVTQIV